MNEEEERDAIRDKTINKKKKKEINVANWYVHNVVTQFMFCFKMGNTKEQMYLETMVN